jgi:hypothetical protein
MRGVLYLTLNASWKRGEHAALHLRPQPTNVMEEVLCYLRSSRVDFLLRSYSHIYYKYKLWSPTTPTGQTAYCRHPRHAVISPRPPLNPPQYPSSSLMPEPLRNNDGEPSNPNPASWNLSFFPRLYRWSCDQPRCSRHQQGGRLLQPHSSSD